jgi:hypothetical protein
MSPSRRDLLRTGAAAVAATGLAGCNAFGSGDGSRSVSVDLAVAAEWNAMRARIRDALAPGEADATGAGAAVVRDTFARFEAPTCEYGAHDVLERTSQDSYEAFAAEHSVYAPVEVDVTIDVPPVEECPSLEAVRAALEDGEDVPYKAHMALDHG